MPPAVDELSEDFAGYPITSTIDYYSEYFQLSLDKDSWDYTAFLTDIELVRNTRLPQGWTNSVATFQRVICKVHYLFIFIFFNSYYPRGQMLSVRASSCMSTF